MAITDIVSLTLLMFLVLIAGAVFQLLLSLYGLSFRLTISNCPSCHP